MRRGSVLFALVLAGVLPIGAGQLAGAISAFPPDSVLNFTLGGQILPRALPRHELAPASASLFVRVATTDGTHPSALRELVLDVDRDLTIATEGIPTCGRKRLGGLSSIAARSACRGAIVGGGSAWVEVKSPGQLPVRVTVPLTLFNGGTEGGETRLLIDAFAPRPAPTSTVSTVTIAKKGSGLHAIARIPAIAGGNGSVLDLDLKLGKKHTYKGQDLSFLEARCPDGVFEVNVDKALFKNEAGTLGVAPTTVMIGLAAVPCTPES